MTPPVWANLESGRTRTSACAGWRLRMVRPTGRTIRGILILVMFGLGAGGGLGSARAAELRAGLGLIGAGTARTTWIWLVGGLLLAVLGGWFALWSWRSYRETRRQVQAANVDPRSIPAVSLASPAAWIVLACGVGVTLVAWQLCYRHDLEHERFAFRTQATQLQALLRYRLEGYEAILRSAGGFAAGSLEVGNNDWRPFGQEWQAFVQSCVDLLLRGNLPNRNM